MHTSLATAILEQIKERKLDRFFELEEKIMSRQGLDQSLIWDFEDPHTGTPEDKMRLFLIYFLCSEHLTDEEIVRFSEKLQVKPTERSSVSRFPES